MDVTAADTLVEVHQQLLAQDVRLVLCSLDPGVRAELDHYGTLELLGADATFGTVADVADAFAARDLTS